MDEKQIKEILQAQRGAQPSRTFGCPEENKMASYVDGQLSDNARTAFERHLSDCQSCLAAIGFLARSAEWDESPDIPPYLVAHARRLVTQKAPAVWGWRWAIASAAAACVLIVFSFVIFKSGIQEPTNSGQAPLVARNQETPAPAVGTPTAEPAAPAPTRSVTKPKSNGEHTPSVRGNEGQPKPRLVFPLNGAIVRQRDLEFRWAAMPDVTFYTVSVVKADGSLVKEIEVKAPTLKLADDTQLAADQTYFVTVIAHTNDGRTQKSEIVRFRVAKE